MGDEQPSLADLGHPGGGAAAGSPYFPGCQDSHGAHPLQCQAPGTPGCSADVAVRRAQEVFPEAPVRQWVCSTPRGIRAVLGYDRKLAPTW